jgi:DNA (cytosine-5)-methyltransferase 1
MIRPLAIDLFSGIGGLSLGIQRAGFQVLAGVEVNPLSAESYALNFPDVTLWRSDIRDVDPADMMKALQLAPGDLALLAGCPPCQGFSTIRTRRGPTVRDARNQLILEFLRFAAALSPRAVMIENVPGLASYGLFRKLVSGLRALDYNVRSGVFDAADYGVPQRRKRLLLLASREGIPVFGSPDAVRQTVRQAIGEMPTPGASGDALHDLSEHRSARIKEMISQIPKDGGSRGSLSDAAQLACHQRLNGFKDVYGRMKWDAVAPTITGGCINPSKGRFLHPEEDRAITLREALLLQGFPPRFQLSLARGKLRAAELVGNALPPPLVARHAASLRESLPRVLAADSLRTVPSSVPRGRTAP